MATITPSSHSGRFRTWRLWGFLVPGLLVLASLLVPETARAQSAPFLAYSGTAEMTVNQFIRTTAAPGSALRGTSWQYPPAAVGYLNTRQIEMHFAVRDETHYRFDIQTVEPALDAGTRTIIVNGDQMWVYDTRMGVAATYPVPSVDPASTTPDPAGVLNVLLHGNDLRGLFGGGMAYVLPDPTSSVDAYITALNAAPAPAGTTRSAGVVGHDTLLGRPVDVIDYGPYLGNLGSSRLWVDAQHPFLLKEEDQFGQAPAGSGDMPNDLLYRVTSIDFGTGPSDSDLTPSFPVTPVVLERAPGTADGNSSGGGSPPAPFLAVQAPDASVFQTVCDPWSWREEGPAYATQSVTQLFLAQRSECGAPTGDGPYVMVQQRIQVSGLPSALQVGSPTTINGCRIWSGTYPDGQSWAALAVGQVAIQVSSNALSADQLTQYAGSAVCTAHAATTDPNPPGILLPPDTWYCVGGTATKPTITIYKYAQRGEQCFHYLDQAVALLSPSVQEIIPPGASGSVDTSNCSISGSAASDPPGAVYFVRCPSMGGRGWAAGWSGNPTDGPNPIKPGATTQAKKPKKPTSKKPTKKHKAKKHAHAVQTSRFVEVHVS